MICRLFIFMTTLTTEEIFVSFTVKRVRVKKYLSRFAGLGFFVISLVSKLSD